MRLVIQCDFVIAGAGIAGLSLAIELNARGAKVLVLEAAEALAQSSTAAAGMLAADDPGNPPALLPLARHSLTLYPGYLDRIAELSGTRVPFQTTATLQAVSPVSTLTPLADPTALVPQLVAGAHPFALLAERSVDPRQLAPALLQAVRNAGIELREHTPLKRLSATPTSVQIETDAGPIAASALTDCMGAWSPAPIVPRKGQMLSVTLPHELDLTTVIRTEHVYIVPRTEGPAAGRAIIGATVEHAGFDLTVRPRDILMLNAMAVELLPPLAEATFVESWAGTRPGTADGLPFLGATSRQPRYILANGLFRNGILLAPAVAHVVAQMLLNEPTAVDLAPFTPTRF